MYAKRIQLNNYGPIERLDVICPFNGDKPKPVILVGENGSGKSILLSHIVNGLLLAQQVAYPEAPEVTAGKVYKFRSPLYIKSGQEYSFSKIEYENNLYIGELQLLRKRRDYQNIPAGIPETDAQTMWDKMDSSDSSVLFPSRLDKKRVEELFGQNCILYFLPNRFEDPAWLNTKNLEAEAQYMNTEHLHGFTDRNIIHYSPLHDNENWFFDVAYDFSVFELNTPHLTIPVEQSDKSKLNVPIPIFAGFSGSAKTIYDIAIRVVQTIIRGNTVRFGIGRRTHRVVSIMENEKTRVPNIFQLSGGEVSLLNLFLSILRDFDLCQTSFTKADDIRGIVVVDEIDLHLHAVHQYEILPRLMQMFPRVQFVVTTHSALFALGLQNTFGEDGIGLYRLPQGQKISPEEFGEFGDAYRAFKRTNTHSVEIRAEVEKAKIPLVFVDGTTDIRYIIRAADLLGRQDILQSIEIRDGGGDGNLKTAWRTLTTVDVIRQAVVLLHDCESSASSCDRGNVFRRKVPLIKCNPIKTGIENLFSMETLKRAITYKSAFIDIVEEHECIERGQRKIVPERWMINKDEKGNLCNWLCEKGTMQDFRHFPTIFDELRNIPGLYPSATTDQSLRVGTCEEK